MWGAWGIPAVSPWFSFVAGSSRWGFTKVVTVNPREWAVYAQFRTVGSGQTNWMLADAYYDNGVYNTPRITYSNNTCLTVD